MSQPLKPDQLSEPSQVFARSFLTRFPGLLPACSTESIEGVPGHHLLIELRSPAGRDRDITIWMDGGEEPSLTFSDSGWHVHADYVHEIGPGHYQHESLLDLCDAILHDQVVGCVEPGAKPKPFASVVDLREPNALLKALTGPNSPDHLQLKTFTGKGDRQVSLTDFAD